MVFDTPEPAVPQPSIDNQIALIIHPCDVSVETVETGEFTAFAMRNELCVPVTVIFST